MKQRLKQIPHSTDRIELNFLNLKICPNLNRFHSIMILNISHNRISNISYFPKTLNTIYCNDNELTDLPELPENLFVLWCYNNNLESLPSLPNQLIRLKCGNNLLKSLPSLPNQLEHLCCYSNYLTQLPDLPDSLLKLYCSYNQLTYLPDLPVSLVELYCYTNHMIRLPPIHYNLKELNCSDNLISEMPYFQLCHFGVPCLLNFFGLNNNPIYNNSIYGLMLSKIDPLYIIRILHKFKRCYYKHIIHKFMIHCIWVFRRPKLEEYFKPDNVLKYLENNNGDIDALDNM